MSAPQSAKALVKSKIYKKENFPYGQNEYETFYNPTCISTMLKCKDICGNKCKRQCKVPKPHPEDCQRGELKEKFMYCPMRSSECDVCLSFVTYELVVDTHIKEGKSEYKKTEKVETEKSLEEFIAAFTGDFTAYAQHTLEAWYLTTVKNAAFCSNYQPSFALHCVSDFAQNLLVKKKQEVSEE